MHWAALALLAGCEEGGLTGLDNKPDFVTIDLPGVVDARGVNVSGDVVGRYCCSGDGRDLGFVLREGVLTTIDFPGSIFTSALGINDAGQIVGRYADEHGVSHGYLLSDSGYSSIDFPGATFTTTTGINAAGNIVGTYIDGMDVLHPFLLSQGNFVTIDVPGPGPNAHAISSSDEIVGFTGTRAYRVQVGQSPTLIDVPGAAFTIARGIASNGTIVGWYETMEETDHGFLLDDELHSIDVPGSVRTVLGGISADGRLVVGGYEDAQGGGHPFRATPEQVLRWASQMDDGGGSGSEPVVARADPSVLPTQATVDVRIFGSEFDEGSRVELLKDGRPSLEVMTRTVVLVSPTELVVTLDITPDAPLGSYDVQVEDRKGKQGIGTELIDIDSTSVSGTWDLTGRVHGPSQDCAIAGGLKLSQNDHDIQGSAVLGFTCFVFPIGNPTPMTVTGTLAENGHDLLLTLGDPGCELQGAHQGGVASGEILPCTNLGDVFIAPPDSTFSGTWRAERR